MNNEICILSTKKLKGNQKMFLLNAGFSVVEADFVKITLLAFQLKNTPKLLLFTSQNGVQSVLNHPKATDLKAIPAICVGFKTAELLQENGFRVLVWKDYAQELAPIIQEKFAQEHIAFFAGNLRRNVLPQAMTQANIHFDEYLVYQNDEVSVKIEAKTKGILFYSPSGIKNYLKKNTITNQTCFCIGTTTADALKGITENIVIARQQTVENVIVQCINYFSNKL
ncbi:MAG TPA: uroporphyrinogen-III synthase [Flavobacterium sp.]|nr:uroporphyrinogen-III synthase [Flavobacterium sp.]